MNLRCIIVEDEYPASRLLNNFINRIPELTLVETFKNALKVPDFLSKNPVELMFLDIQMPFVSGTELLKNLSEKPVTIFTTANPQYALQAFDLDVLDYLVKPFSFDRFQHAVKKAIEYHTFKQIAATNQADTPPQYLSIKSDYRTVKIIFDEILYIEGLSEYVKIITPRKNYVTLIAMKELESQLAPSGFSRVHKSYIVNLSKIRSHNSRQVVLENAVELPIGRVYKGLLTL